MKRIENILDKGNYNNYDHVQDFKDIIFGDLDNYGKNKEGLKSFLEDMQKGGCMSGMIGQFIYHADCKNFYIKHIDSLEEFKTDLEEELGEPIKNRHDLPHYTFVCWLCFEEYCYDIYRTVFDA